MGKEIERKFLVKGDAWRVLAEGAMYRQGYLNSARERAVRVRAVGGSAVGGSAVGGSAVGGSAVGGRAFLTVKGITVGATRAEYEYEIPFADGNALLDNLAEKPLIEKKRYTIAVKDLIWEVDEFFGDNQGLIVAEVELQSEDQPIDKPDWIGDEVSGDPRYFNSNLVKHPFTTW